jgi:hypothetical protein
VRVELDMGEILQTQVGYLRTWVTFKLGDYDRTRPSTIPPNHEAVRASAGANRSVRYLVVERIGKNARASSLAARRSRERAMNNTKII